MFHSDSAETARSDGGGDGAAIKKSRVEIEWKGTTTSSLGFRERRVDGRVHRMENTTGHADVGRETEDHSGLGSVAQRNSLYPKDSVRTALVLHHGQGGGGRAQLGVAGGRRWKVEGMSEFPRATGGVGAREMSRADRKTSGIQTKKTSALLPALLS